MHAWRQILKYLVMEGIYSSGEDFVKQEFHVMSRKERKEGSTAKKEKKYFWTL